MNVYVKIKIRVYEVHAVTATQSTSSFSVTVFNSLSLYFICQ